MEGAKGGLPNSETVQAQIIDYNTNAFPNGACRVSAHCKCNMRANFRAKCESLCEYSPGLGTLAPLHETIFILVKIDGLNFDVCMVIIFLRLCLTHVTRLAIVDIDIKLFVS